MLKAQYISKGGSKPHVVKWFASVSNFFSQFGGGFSSDNKGCFPDVRDHDQLIETLDHQWNPKKF